MNIHKTHCQDQTTLNLSGRLDTVTAPALLDVLVSEFDNANDVIVDFAGLNYVSSPGLHVLIAGEKTAKSKGKKQTLANISNEIMEVIEIAGCSNYLHFA